MSWLAIQTLAGRECVRFYRQKARVVGALLSPLIFWLLLGLGLGQSFQSQAAPQGAGYLEYLFPGTLILVVLFTSIFSSISIIEDRNEGFLQSVLVAPVSVHSLLGGKILGSTLLALFQGALFLILAPLAGFSLSWLGFGLALLALFLIAFSLSSLGFYFAWRLNSVQGFHSIMNSVLFPLWLLSGALFPVETAPWWLRIPMRLNPVTYGLSILRSALYVGRASQGLGDRAALAPSLVVLGLFGLVFYRLSARGVARMG